MDIVKTHHYKVMQAVEKPFMNFGKFKTIRENLGMSCEKECFKCGRRFLDSDNAYLVIVKRGGGRLVCQECNKDIIETLKREKEK